MARIDPQRSAPRKSARRSLVWRGTKAVGASAGRAVGRRLQRIVLLVLIAFVVLVMIRGIVVNVQTPGTPLRVVGASQGTALQRLRQADLDRLVLTEGDLTAAFNQATALPTFPFGDGQVAVTPEWIEIHGHLKHSSTTATIEARLQIRDGKLDFILDRIVVGQQSVPKFLYPMLAVGTVDQAALFANQIVPPLASVVLDDASLTLQFL